MTKHGRVPDRGFAPCPGISLFSAIFERGELGFGSQNTQGRNQRERGRFEGTLGVELEDFFALGSSRNKPELED
ncbi:unnamed protein product [Linum trigynum]|uniref:Uncharacterized protein n=1 Tax=Linum trigynum TaxID=586398 RepID=A0AAV2CUF4_9ROSI